MFENTTALQFLICTICSLVYGVIIALLHMYKNNYSKNFIITLVILPAIVQAVIMLVNGNLGTSVAVMGAFSLVRFRSVPGNSREIGSIFLAMAVGLATGMEYISIAGIMVVVIGAAMLLMVSVSFGEAKKVLKDLRITIPENLDYDGLFDDVLKEYTSKNNLVKVKTVNMGSLYELHYRILLKNNGSEKEFIDAIRCRNGNLNVTCGYVPTETDQL